MRIRIGALLLAAFATLLPASASAHHPVFPDMVGDWFEADVERLAAAGITEACRAGEFCPGRYLTRGQLPERFLGPDGEQVDELSVRLRDDADRTPFGVLSPMWSGG